MWRPTLSEDDHYIVEMAYAFDREDPSEQPVPKAHTWRTLQELRESPIRGKAVLLESEGQVAGYALLISFWSNELGGEVCNIDELYIRPQFRHKGYGRLLVELLSCQNSIWPNSIVALELEISPSNVQGRNFFQKLGFNSIRNSHMRLLRRDKTKGEKT